MKELMKSDKLLRIAFFAGLAAILLIFVSSFFGTEKDEAETVQNSYEARLYAILTEMEGISKERPPSVLIKVDKDDQTVLGAVIVSESAADPVLKERILNVTSKALDVSPARICVTV